MGYWDKDGCYWDNSGHYHPEIKDPRTVERRLKDYKEYQVWKVRDASSNWEYRYLLCDSEGEIINEYKSLKELKDDN